MDWRQAVEPAGDGVRLLLEVRPGAASTCFPDGYDPWRGRLRARVRAPARDGAANQELLGEVAQRLRVPADRVRIGQGGSGRRKTVVVEGLARADAVGRLAAAMDRPGQEASRRRERRP